MLTCMRYIYCEHVDQISIQLCMRGLSIQLLALFHNLASEVRNAVLLSGHAAFMDPLCRLVVAV